MKNEKKQKSDKPWLDAVNNFYEREEENKTESPPNTISTKCRVETNVVEKKGYKRIVIELDDDSAYKASIYALLQHMSRKEWIRNLVLEKLCQMKPIDLNAKRNEKE